MAESSNLQQDGVGPRRIQLRRTEGWRKPDGAVIVARPSRWGNPYRVTTMAELWRNPRYTTSPELVVWLADRQGRRSGPQWAGFADRPEAARFATDLFRRSLLALAVSPDGELDLDFYLSELRGRDLACWCPLDEPCHADVLLELANTEGGGAGMVSRSTNHPLHPPAELGRQEEGA